MHRIKSSPRLLWWLTLTLVLPAGCGDKLPPAAAAYVSVIEERLGAEVCLIGTGRERERVLAQRGLEAVAR